MPPTAHHLFFSRVAAFTESETWRLKAEDARLDSILAFHDSTHGAAASRAWYPQSKGVGLWIDDLLKGPLRNVQFVTDSRVVQVETHHNIVTAVRTESGARYPLDRLVWGVGAYPLLRAVGRPPPHGVTAPRLRHTGLAHIVVDRPLATPAHYLNLYEPSMKAFRITVYDNLRDSRHLGRHPFTVETLLEPDEPLVRPEDLLDEIRKVGLLDEAAIVFGATSDRVTTGFPVPDHRFGHTNRALLGAVSDLNAVCLVGRGSGTSFFMADVLRETPDRVEKLMYG